MFYWRSTPHCSTGISPAELHCNIKFRTRFDILKSEVGVRVLRKQDEQKRFFKGNREVEFKVDDVVITKDYMTDN